MGFFKKAKKSDGWLTVTFLRDGVCAGRVQRVRDAKAVVELSSFYPADHSLSPEALERMHKDVKAGNYRCSTMLAGGEYQMLMVERPNVPPDEMKTAVRWRLKDMLDFHIDDATIDVLDIPADTSAAARGQQMFAIAARNSLIQSRQTLFSESGLDLTVIDIPEMAQRNISALLETDGRGLAMLSFGADGGLLTITYKTELYLSRRIDVTLEQLLERDSDRQQAQFDKITLELQRSLDHFDRQFSFVNVLKLLLAPTGAEGLHEHLAANLYTPVEAMELADVFDLSKAPELQDTAQQQRFFLTLGAALRHEEVHL
ncbi:agglutinin biogenesis protein MshI [Duganella sp. FT80W]|uniref:Agglutinin biogenesis protein MshI n=1 Tax=Duganella guangzhouensis TaxID=2666084 RepID=A0A6I2LA27_9BURK|nr:agglutinin biogenesis protein MshI [Duganella guangzhouensis]MRW93586.1 agglutinin biogenesis protein MshI [Duganella guangzhouensis]